MSQPAAAPPDLPAITDALRQTSSRLVADLVRLGELLAQAQQALVGDGFRRWYETELGWSKSTVYRLLDVYKAFGGSLTSHAGNVEPTALYLLAQPGVPVAAREYAVELIGDGEPVTAAVARDILASYKPPAGPRQPVAIAVGPAPDLPPWAAAARELVAQADQVHVTRAVDDETGESTFTGRAYLAGERKPKLAEGDTVEELLLALAGKEGSRRCGKCQTEKPLRAFRRNAGQVGGREHQCRECAKKRQRERRTARKAQAA